MSDDSALEQLLRSPRSNGLSPSKTEQLDNNRSRGGLANRSLNPLGLLTIQPTPFCNINCEYCYLPDRTNHQMFDLNLLEPLFLRLSEAGLIGPQLNLSWHAGEPLSLPAGYYRMAIDKIDKLRLRARVNHSFQTNGTLINSEYCDLFKRPNVQVSLSIDGPAFLHDKKRKTRSGTGTHAKAMDGLLQLKRHGIRYSAIAVVSKDSLHYADEIYDFFSENGFGGLALNIDELEGSNRTTSYNCNDDEKAYARFLSRLIERSVRDGRTKWLREFNVQLSKMLDCTHKRSSLSAEATPFSLITADVQGRLYTYSPELAGLEGGAYSIGHIRDVDFKLLWENARFIKLYEEITHGVDLCRQTCSYFDVCGGGAPVNKLFENGTFMSSETIFCRIKKKITHDVVEEFVIENFRKMRSDRLSRIANSTRTDPYL